MASELQASTVSSPTLATGYGPLSISEFGNAIASVLATPNLAHMSLNLIVRRDDHVKELYDVLNKAGLKVAE